MEKFQVWSVVIGYTDEPYLVPHLIAEVEAENFQQACENVCDFCDERNLDNHHYFKMCKTVKEGATYCYGFKRPWPGVKMVATHEEALRMAQEDFVDQMENCKFSQMDRPNTNLSDDEKRILDAQRSYARMDKDSKLKES